MHLPLSPDGRLSHSLPSHATVLPGLQAATWYALPGHLHHSAYFIIIRVIIHLVILPG